MPMSLHCLHCLGFLDLDLSHIERLIELGGYGMLFGLLVACGMGLPLPEDIPLMASGWLISKGHMHPVFAASVAWLGIMAGDTVLYCLARRYGRNITKVPFVGTHISEKRLAKTEEMFARFGVAVVALGRLFAGIRGAMVAVAGTIRYPYYKFIAVDAIAAVASGGMFMYLGYWCGIHSARMTGMIEEKSSELAWWIRTFGGMALLVLLVFIWWRMRENNAQRKIEIRQAKERADEAVSRSEKEHNSTSISLDTPTKAN